ncbi:hypothetical protein EZV62_014492 [Acer yangbiense]|uniref:Protein kinase domain-containing protein n=1 Tax=Acer yangbiense TaxID=1000413 RepID=A0A5C7HT47_9ROSI|nr:hypothetical protein EZV62_014492 [Acer yangbiense]
MASAGSSSAAESQFSVVEENPNGQISASPFLKEFSFADLKTATSNFGHKALLGAGAYGRVYIGWFDEKTLSHPSESGIGMAVAIKIYYPETIQAFDQWQSEVNILGRLYHPNLIELLGYCWEDEKLILVYEFMHKGSDVFKPLSWDIWLRIAIEAARGHLYVKSDVYSFCSVLLELLTGLRAGYLIQTNGNLVEWLKPMLSQPKTLMDVRMKGQYSLGVACNATQLTLKCLEDNHKNRPSMKEVLEVLVQIEAMTSTKEDPKVLEQIEAETSMKEVPEVLEQIEAVTSKKEVPEVLEHIEAIEEKPKNSNYRSRQSTAARHGQRSILHRFLTSLKEPFQCVSSKLNCMRI